MSIFDVVFFVSKSHLGIERQKKLDKKNYNFDLKTSESCQNIGISNVAHLSLTMESEILSTAIFIYLEGLSLIYGVEGLFHQAPIQVPKGQPLGRSGACLP